MLWVRASARSGQSADATLLTESKAWRNCLWNAISKNTNLLTSWSTIQSFSQSRALPAPTLMCNGRANGYLSLRFSLSRAHTSQCARPLCKFACPFHGKWTEMLIISNIHYILEISVLLLRSLLLLMLHYNDHQHDEVVKYAASKHHHPSLSANAFGPSGINQLTRERSLCAEPSLASSPVAALSAWYAAIYERSHTSAAQRAKRELYLIYFRIFGQIERRASFQLQPPTLANDATHSNFWFTRSHSDCLFVAYFWPSCVYTQRVHLFGIVCTYTKVFRSRCTAHTQTARRIMLWWFYLQEPKPRWAAHFLLSRVDQLLVVTAGLSDIHIWLAIKTTKCADIDFNDRG